jgi:hypothetical protein
MKQAQLRTLCVVIGGVIAMSCQSESSKQSSTEEASKQEGPAGSASPKKEDKLARALASAIEPGGTDTRGPSGSNDKSPPSDGVLERNKADSLAALHSAPTVSLGSAGSEPRVKLVHRSFTNPVRVSLQIAVDLGNGQGIPPVDFKLEVKSVAPAAGGNAAQALSARLLSADISAPNVPAEFKAQLRKLQGARFAFKVADNGGAFDCGPDSSAAKGQDLGDLLEMVAQGLADACQPMPSESVGAGAYWMTTSRQRLLGLDWVTYDMVKVTQVLTNEVKMDVNTRRYVVGREVPAPPGAAGPKLSVREATASGNAQAVAAMTGNMLTGYERSQSVRLVMDSSDNSGQRMMQAGGQTKFALVR